jgi:hypothetical protein
MGGRCTFNETGEVRELCFVFATQVWRLARYSGRIRHGVVHRNVSRQDAMTSEKNLYNLGKMIYLTDRQRIDSAHCVIVEVVTRQC